VTPAGFLALIAPCGGSSGLPKEPARAVVVAETIAPAAVAVSMSRLEIIVRSCSENPLVLLYIDCRQAVRRVGRPTAAHGRLEYRLLAQTRNSN
jgi:hypothetical protein